MGDEAPWTHELVADVELFHRMGATEFQVGHLDDVPKMEDARWWCSVRWRGHREMEDDYPGPALATRALARRLLEGAECVHCGKRVTTSDDGAADGVCTAGVCRWYPDDDHWRRGCDGGYGPPAEGLNRAQRRRQAKVQRLGR